MYGLFVYTYDYYEWETLICVSPSIDNLVKVAKGRGYTLVSEEEHYHLQDREKIHCCINEVEVV